MPRRPIIGMIQSSWICYWICVGGIKKVNNVITNIIFLEFLKC